MKNKFLLSILLGAVVACVNTQAYPIGSLLDENALTCSLEPTDKIVQLYGLSSSDASIRQTSKEIISVGNTRISGIKSYTGKDKNIFLSLMFEYPKDGMKITKLSFLSSPEHSEDEWGGYYYILNGEESDFLKFKSKYHIDDDMVTKTPAGNYRVTCVIVG